MLSHGLTGEPETERKLKARACGSCTCRQSGASAPLMRWVAGATVVATLNHTRVDTVAEAAALPLRLPMLAPSSHWPFTRITTSHHTLIRTKATALYAQTHGLGTLDPWCCGRIIFIQIEGPFRWCTTPVPLFQCFIID